MRCLFVNAYTQPENFEISDLPVPKITSPDQVLIKVHAAGINPVDLQVASGEYKMAMPTV